MTTIESIEIVNSVVKTVMLLLISALLLITFFYHRKNITKNISKKVK